jgi:cytochrome c biogenesis protein CcmG, thiol:disulfide interchange protein DsbE
MAAVLAFALLSGYCAAAAAAPPERDLELRTLDGRAFSLDSLDGRAVLLDFWAPWCIPCRASFPFLNGLQEKFRGQGLRVVGLTLEQDSNSIFDFIDSVPARFPVVRDPTGHAGEAFDVVAMPTALLLDRNGNVLARFEGGGPLVDTRIEAAVAALLSGKPLPPDAGVRVTRSLEATSRIKAWQRGYLADPIMNLDGDALTRLLREHVHASKEAASGNGGAAGGGCGCN